MDNTALEGTTELQEISNRGHAKTRPKGKQSCFFTYRFQEGEKGWRGKLQIKTDVSDTTTSHTLWFWNLLPTLQVWRGHNEPEGGADAQESPAIAS